MKWNWKKKISTLALSVVLLSSVPFGRIEASSLPESSESPMYGSIVPNSTINSRTTPDYSTSTSEGLLPSKSSNSPEKLAIANTDTSFNSNEKSTVSTITDTEMKVNALPAVHVLKEFVDKRTRNSKSYLNSDGTSTVQTSVYSLNYFDGRAWQVIDTTIRPDRADSNYTHSMSANNFKVRLNNKGINQSVTFSVYDQSVTYRAIGMNNVTGDVYENTTIYRNAWGSTDLLYQVQNDQLKMELHLTDNTAPKKFEFEMKTKDVTSRMNADGSIDFINDNGDISFQIPRLWVKDASSDEERYDKLKIDLKQKRSKTVLELTLDDRGLQYPVVIDPTTSLPIIDSGTSHILQLGSDGTVWARGNNSYGQLGNGTTNNSSIAVQVSGLSNVIAVATGANHSIAVKQDGTVWAWGDNSSGQLGDGTTSNSSIPVQVSILSNIVAIKAGTNHSIAIKQDGTIWSWGNNANGQLGNGTTTNSLIPVQISGLSNVVSISAGSYHNYTLIVKQDGTVWAWGDNQSGQLGIGTFTKSLVPVQVSGLSNVIATATGKVFSIAVKQDGTVWAWGNNSSGQLGNGTTTSNSSPIQVNGLSNAVAVAAGLSHSLVVKQDGTVWAWGNNSSGQLGNGTTTKNSSPSQVNGLSNAVAVSAGLNHSIAIKEDGTVWGWGSNSSGQLGAGPVTITTAVNVSFFDTQAPTAPTSLAVAGIIANSVTLSWTASTDDIAVTSYDIYNGSTVVGSVEGSTTTYKVTGLIANTAYAFTVKAKDAVGNVSEASNVVNLFTDFDMQAPTVPSNFKVSVKTSSTVTLKWTSSTDNVGVTGYDIYNGSTVVGSVDGSTKTYTVTGLLVNTTYNFTVKAKDAAGNVSVASNAVNVLIDTQAPTAPSGLTSGESTANSLTLSWTASTDNVGITGYDIYQGSTLTGSVNGTTTTYKVTGLTANMSYTFTVKAKDAAGNVSLASNVIKTMIDTEAPTAPTNLAVSGTTNSTITLMWRASTDNVGVTGYDIYEGSTLKGTVDGTTTTYTVTGLTANTLYNFSVKAKDAAGNISAASSLLQAKIDTQVPSGPRVMYTYRGSTYTDDLSNWPSLINAKSTSYNGSYSDSYIRRYVLYNDNTIKYTIGSDRTPKTEDPNLWPSLENSKSFSFSSSNSQGHVYVYRYVFYNDNTVKYTVDASLSYPNAVYSENVSVWPSFENAKSMSFGFFGFSYSNSIRNIRYVLYNDNTVKYTENGSTPRTDTTNWPNLTNAKSISFYWDADNPTRHVGYTDQDPIINVSNTNQLISKQGSQNIISISGTVSDADNDTVTVSATIAGVTKTAVITNTASLQNWTLSWNVDSENIPVGSYSNLNISARDTLWGTASMSYTGIITVDTFPSTPSNLSPGTQNSLTPSISTLSPILTWKFNDPDPGDVQSAYQVIVTNSKTAGAIMDTGWMNSNSAMYTVPVGNLARGNTYSWSVRVKDSKGGISVYSTPAYIQANQLPVVSNVGVRQSGDNKFNFSWEFSDSDGQLQSNFQIFGSQDDWITTGYNSGIITSSSSNFISPVLSGQNWKFKIQVSDGLDWSNQVSMGIIDVTPPTAPSQLKISKYNENSIELVWQEATDDVGVAAYDVYDKDAYLATASATKQTISNLLQNKLYIIYVKARDTSGNISTASNFIYFYTGSHQYFYNAQGRIDYIRLSSGQIIKYQYDSNGNLINTQLQ
ncbi:RCC1 domain-containing protein [Paenibacillus alba]|uniref:Fibronectin type III domain-containing protein n=1 Tax=Paenibacillus alba TaxID=1197127 RepID=A0ABU6GJ03_9BACL|nr:fibronectin type III domain-containing protein [Paenibacillus alba]MEC0232629.1 fibronectin type III domain-containing protein [Paenibacillus alba]